MTDYISREELIEEVNRHSAHWLNEWSMLGVLAAIDRIPAADVRPVVKATWKRIDYKPCGHDYECSSCGWKNDMETHFCPNCGARMEES